MNIRVDKENKNTVVFIAVFICAGIIYMLSFLDDPMISVFLYCLNYIIYIGLLLFWIQSVHERLLPTRERKYVIGAAIFMLIFLTQRVFKYRVASDNTVARYTGYAYFVPEMFITAFFLMTCIRIYFGKRKNVKEYLFLIPVVIFVVIVLTNDVHNLVYIPKVELNDFYIQAGTYNYGVMFYVLYIWMITTYRSI